MKVSTKGRYGLRALADLAIHSKDNQVALVSIAQRQKISLNYLEQVFAALRKAGVVKSIKGSQGGYVLANQPANISIATILQVLEGDLLIQEELPAGDTEVNAMQKAVQILVWDELNQSVQDILGRITLNDLVEEYLKIQNEGQDMYYI